MINIDVIITTYNRPKKVNELVNQLNKLAYGPKKVIVVDSSNDDNLELKYNRSVTYVKSDRKSQPYQRFLGVNSISSDLVCFFDDDVQILEENLFVELFNAFKDNSIVGVSAGIFYENGVPLNQLQKKITRIATGKISWLGKTTGLPNKNKVVEYFPGPIMSFRREILKSLFDEYMFKIFEDKIAMGEDKVISMRASQFGQLFYLGEKNYLYHPPEPSNYYSDDISFIAKTIFSRLWLNKVYADVKGKPKWLAYIIFTGYFAKHFLLNFFKMKHMKAYGKALTYIYKY